MRISDWSSDVCSSDLEQTFASLVALPETAARAEQGRGIALLLKGQDEASQLSLQRAVALDPALWRAWNGIGLLHDRARSGERRVGKECVRTCRSRWSPYH